MDFLKNLGSSIASGASSIFNTLKNVGSSIGSYLSNQTASAIGAFTGPLSPTQQTYNPAPKPPLQIYEVKDTPQGEVAYGQNNPNVVVGGKTYYNAQGGANTDFNTFMAGGIRPSTTVTPVSAPKTQNQLQPDAFGRISTREIGTPYIDAKGNLIVPKVGFSGVTGQGGAGLSSVAPQGQQGDVVGALLGPRDRGLRLPLR